MGVCCILFDIDGMLFEFFMNKIFFSIFHVFFAFYAISNIKKIIPVIAVRKNIEKIFGEGGGRFFLEKHFFLISRYILFSTLQIKFVGKY